MIVIKSRNVNDAFKEGVELFRPLVESGARITPREGAGPGPCIEAGPVTTCYERPTERVLWNVRRDCNPFFHLMESLWMLAGRDDVAFLEQYSSGIAQFSDDGEKFNGAYGFRWREFFTFDQLEEVIALLHREPASRRAILTMWSPGNDLLGGGNSKDLPCNMIIKFEIREARLNMCVFNRSNDMIWGAYGANAVHFSILQEYVAASLGVEVGRYWQISGNFHVYLGSWGGATNDATGLEVDHYDIDARPFPLVENPDDFLHEVEDFVNGEERWLKRNPFLYHVALPMKNAWALWKLGEKERARDYIWGESVNLAGNGAHFDWLLAGFFWMRHPKRNGGKS